MMPKIHKVKGAATHKIKGTALPVIAALTATPVRYIGTKKLVITFMLGLDIVTLISASP